MEVCLNIIRPALRILKSEYRIVKDTPVEKTGIFEHSRKISSKDRGGEFRRVLFLYAFILGGDRNRY